MDVPTPNLHDVYHLARKSHFEAKRKGQESHTALAVMGSCMVFMGATMLLRAWNQSHGRGR